MQKNMENLANKNIVLQARNPENEDARNSHTGSRCRKDKALNQNQEGSNEKEDYWDVESQKEEKGKRRS